MQLCKVIKNEPIKNFICVYSEENGIKHARVAQRTLYRAKYCQLTRKEIKTVLDNPCYTHVEQLKTDNWILEREKEWNLATIYYHEVNGVKEVFDIHYHKNGNINGKRTQEQVIADTNAIIEECGFNINLFIGGFMAQKKAVQRKTNKHTVKQYTKIK
jgi:hypothetical protein